MVGCHLRRGCSPDGHQQKKTGRKPGKTARMGTTENTVTTRLSETG